MLRKLLLLALLAPAAQAAEPPVVLHCARGTPDYPDAEMTLSARGSHVVHVTYVGYRPSRARADWSLNDCLFTASRLDGSRDIVAWLWYREHARGALPELLGTRTRQAGR